MRSKLLNNKLKHIEAEIFGAVERSISGSFNLRYFLCSKVTQLKTGLKQFDERLQVYKQINGQCGAAIEKLQACRQPGEEV